MPIEGWDESYREVVRGLAEIAASVAEGSTPKSAAARRTGGLPVYCDIGGCLVITPAGDVLEYAFEGETVTPVTDRSSIRLARAAAADTHQIFASLMPTDGTKCEICDGTGRFGSAQLRCGNCEGTGLVADV